MCDTSVSREGGRGWISSVSLAPAVGQGRARSEQLLCLPTTLSHATTSGLNSFKDILEIRTTEKGGNHEAETRGMSFQVSPEMSFQGSNFQSAAKIGKGRLRVRLG